MQAKISYFKNPHIKIDLLLLPSRGQNPLSYYTLFNESKHNIQGQKLKRKVTAIQSILSWMQFELVEMKHYPIIIFKIVDSLFEKKIKILKVF